MQTMMNYTQPRLRPSRPSSTSPTTSRRASSSSSASASAGRGAAGASRRSTAISGRAVPRTASFGSSSTSRASVPCPRSGSLGRRASSRNSRRANCWRREWDSNPRRLTPQRFSRPPPSTTRPSLRERTTLQSTGLHVQYRLRSRRGAGVVDQGCLLSSCPGQPGPRVRIPPSPPSRFPAALAAVFFGGHHADR